MHQRLRKITVHDYDLSTTLESGQAFRWRNSAAGWEGVIRNQWIRIIASGNQWIIETSSESDDWWRDYFRMDEDLAGIQASFPKDPSMTKAVFACPGLRLLRQDPWECLASFICSSTKQIVQIQEIIRLLCHRYGTPVASRAGDWRGFPSAEVIAGATETELRACKLGFRAPYLLGTARRLVTGHLDLESLRSKPLEEARMALMECPGVGRKIADCVLLFAYGFPDAFPVDVWVRKAIQRLYFPRSRSLTSAKTEQFIRKHFGPHAGYAQQYLFHYVRTHLGRGKWK